jgi:hypothetical protein
MLHPLDAIALACLSERILVKKLAAIWCRNYGAVPIAGEDILSWVREEYGSVLKKGQDRTIKLALESEVKHQLAIRKRRQQQLCGVDILECELNGYERNQYLLEQVLGAPRKWLSPKRTAPGAYARYCINSGLVAAIIPTMFKLRNFKGQSLLVYRQSGDRARSYWVPNNLATLDAVFVWLIPEKLHQLMKTGQVRVEHDGRGKKVRAMFPDGSVKLFSWRKVRGIKD